MRRVRPFRRLWITILLFSLQRADAQDARGITVGAPKAFDNRTLNLMLERLNAQLAGINVVDQTALAKAIGAVQGSRITDTARSLTLQGLPIPSIQTENNASSSLTPPATTPTTSNSTKQTTSNPSVTPGIPALPDLLATPSALTNLQYSPSSSDLLGEQVDLTYQIINLRMLLDRSLSDRLLNPNLNPRLQTVVGLNVSIDPPRDAENAVAVVEITLTKKDQSCVKISSCTDGPALVASMPQEHTYNSVALNSKSNAFGGSAVVKLVTVGYSERRRGQTYYMFRDNDTISFERQSHPNSGALTFGWAFRPVLGRKSVAPGARQLFAVVSLPEDDSYNPQATVSPAKYSVEVRTYWRKYDPGTLTTANDKEIRPWSKVGHVLSLGTSLTYPPSGSTDIKGYELLVPLTSTYLSKLLPDIKSVTWYPIGTKQASIAVKGQNLFYDTQVVIGDKLLTGAQDGLRLVSDQGMDITTDISALYGDVAVLGRYGPAKPLEVEFVKKKGLSIMSVDYATALGGYITLTILPSFDDFNCLERGDLKSDQLGQPIVFLNGAPIPGPYLFPSVNPKSPKDCISVSARVPEASMAKLGGIAMLKFPFRQGFAASQRLYDPNAVYHLQTLIPDKDYLLLKDDEAFVPSSPTVPITTKNWQFIIGSDAPTPLADSCPPAAPKGSNVFCLLTPHENLARIMIGKTYACPDTANPKPATAAPASNKKNGVKESVKKTWSLEKADDKPKTCLPKAILLQNAMTDLKTGALSWVATFPLTIPSGDQTTSDSAKPSLDSNQSQSVSQHDLVWRSFTGKSLSAIGDVMISDSKLKINPAKDGKSIAVLIPKWATAYAAEVDLTFLDKQGAQIGTAQVIVKPNPSGGIK